MPDRMLRDELLESDRWLDLPTDAARLTFIGFVLIADDFGNFEGGPRRLFRLLHRFTQIKTEAAALETIGALIECDLLRRYEVEKREFFHIPRFEGNRYYLTRKVPASPWDDMNATLGKDKKVKNKGLAKNIQPILPEHLGFISPVVVVGSCSKERTTLSGTPDVSPPNGQNHPKADALAVLQFLNEKTGRNYRPVKANLEIIEARMKEGATVQELRQVIAKKCREWAFNEKMSMYLRPMTLFNRTKFAQYQGELGNPDVDFLPPRKRVAI